MVITIMGNFSIFNSVSLTKSAETLKHMKHIHIYCNVVIFEIFTRIYMLLDCTFYGH